MTKIRFPGWFGELGCVTVMSLMCLGACLSIDSCRAVIQMNREINESEERGRSARGGDPGSMYATPEMAHSRQ